MTAVAPHLWLRAETKPNERRTALTPAVCRTLIAAGFRITAERCSQRIVPDDQYEAAGCTLAPTGSWRTAPADCFVVGLKELPENDDSPLHHKHIMFAHCFKGQAGWRDVLARFVRGNGLLLDLEFLQENGRRVAAFGYYAGFAGSAVGIDVWCHRLLAGPDAPVPKINPFPNEAALLAHMRDRLARAVEKAGRTPRIMVMGALGRCGRGACDFATAIGIPESHISRWDMAETARGGPFNEILDHDIFVNCIYLSSPIPPFITKDMLASPGRRLTVLSDVSCDATNPNNPVPVYYGASTFDDPVIRVSVPESAPLDVVAIDHLPTLLPLESSEAFCKDLLPSLLALREMDSSRVWTDAADLFRAKCTEAAL